ncbi:NAD-dependent epimerase/dehydratase family protein [Nocardia sp. SYP-A9097]|uniref:NAD-dependent epimerase/dehydratase family protein n=1 Tax=Nocardia sp. SYP-A9097 TaxID=2663237 RepID=UPI00129B3D08|nr:NAD-dependent epimerase/dehydratase family protein [Nocardia sp. SYP-A9097]MRH93581.1 NAD-dependent epimerase/dehydratase family protein [Nocardia sp. SYP-A9097]
MVTARALVTGGAGFVGSHLVDALVGRGYQVLVVDDLSRGSTHNLVDALAFSMELVRQDVRDYNGIRDTVRRFGPEVVFHLAAQVDVRSSMADPAGDAEHNVVGAINVMAAAAEAGARRVVLSSTGGAIYGESAVIPTPETIRPEPLSAYGLGKWTSERYGLWFRQAKGLDVVALRYGNVYGPRQSCAGESGVVALLCGAVVEGREPVVFGDGLQSRDFVFVEDVVEANIAAAESDHLEHQEYNIGSGVEVTVLDLVDTVRAAAGLGGDSWSTRFERERPGEVRRSCLDIGRARRELMPRRGPTTLRCGIEHTLRWARIAQPGARPVPMPAEPIR